MGASCRSTGNGQRRRRALYLMGGGAVQNCPGLYPHPPPQMEGATLRPDPPFRSSDSVEGRRCCPPRPLPPHSLTHTHTHTAPGNAASYCLLTVDCSARTGALLFHSFSQANRRIDDDSSYLELATPSPHHQRKMVPRYQTHPTIPFRPPARPSARVRVQHPVIPPALLHALPPPTRSLLLSKQSFSSHTVGIFSADCSSHLTNQHRSARCQCKRGADQNRGAKPHLHTASGAACVMEQTQPSRRSRQAG